MEKTTRNIIIIFLILFVISVCDISDTLSALSPVIMILFVIFLINCIIANLIARDAVKRRMNSHNWWWAVFIFGLISIMLYVIVRDPRQDI